ncbi:MAG: beta-N-acetylhexosaminidase [Muribaculaceae bacterium]|nr:beta-N-acetylhexosaminidase [Muribaculaceae bacterium]
MKIKFLATLLSLTALCAPAAHSADFVNLTPQPKEMTVGSGQLVLPQEFKINGYNLTEDMANEITKFGNTFCAATGSKISVVLLSSGNGGSRADEALFAVTHNSALHEEGYKLNVTADGVNIEAATPAGLFYAFQTVMKILPPNVILGKYAEGPYALPVVDINDEPRYPWRGLEIDVARHFFDVDEIKKMIDIMAVYKMNRLHWHLTDDQGWRMEMPQYPKLTTEVAAAKNAYWWDFDNHAKYLTNEMYGPHFYTVDQMREVVAYAKERHIEVCPEVDMPGHMQCAIAAYPEFSTTPEGEHPVRYWPGVSTDILDISNPAVMKFLKDVIDYLVDIFPYEYIHIGGDECPTTAWANSANCQAFKQEYGLSSDRAIQNWMVKQLADYAKKDGKRLICWNEIITTSGADKQLAKDADILIYAWLSAGAANNPSKQAAELGLRSVWCSTSHYYLDYPQWSGSDEPVSMGSTITLETVYNAQPDYEEAHKDLYYGVNCNLWTEYIAEPKHLEYNALPRMIAVAETGWTPAAKKSFADFKTRFNADTEMLDLGNYTYGKHYVDNAAGKFMPEPGKYYRLITQAAHDANRKDRCIELVHDGCSLISEKQATVGRLWTNIQAPAGADHYDYQYWTFEADPAGSGKYAMVNRAVPAGSVNPNMQGSSVSASWNYDNSTKNYNFILGDHYGSVELGGVLTIRSEKGADWYLNCAQIGQKQTVNNWSNPVDGNGGMWLFHLEGYVPSGESGVAFTPITSGLYTFNSTIDRGPLAVVDGELETIGSGLCGATGWQVTAGAYNDVTNTQTLTLRNAATGLYIAGLSSTVRETTQGIGFTANFGGNGGYDVLFTSNVAEAAAVTLQRVAEDSNVYFLLVDGKRLFALGPNSIIETNGVNALEGSPLQQGAGWTLSPVGTAMKVTVLDGSEQVGVYYYYSAQENASLPEEVPYEHYEYVSHTAGAVENGHLNVTVNVKRVSRDAFIRLVDTKGRTWEVVKTSCPVGATFAPAAPERPYLTFVENGPVSADTVTFVYSTDANAGIAALGAPVTSVKAGGIYAIEDTHSARHAFRGVVGNLVGGVRSAENASPNFVWTLEANGTNFNVLNEATGFYVQQLERSIAAKAAATPHAFRFTYNNDGDYWTIYDPSVDMCWDGEDGLFLVGWYSPGHQIRIYNIDAYTPFYSINIVERLDGVEFASRTIAVKAGQSYMFAADSRPNKYLVNVTGHEDLNNIYSHKNIVVDYSSDAAIDEVAAEPTSSASGIYDLNGVRLNKIVRPGIYIINGVKTLVK